MSIVELTNDNLNKYIENNMVIDLYAEWCGPCKAMKPDFEDLNSEFNSNSDLNVVFAKVDVDEEEDLAEKFNVGSLPTFVFVKNGVLIGKIEGKLSKDELRQNIQKLIIN